MEQQATAFKDLFTDAGEYLETKAALVKMKAVDKSAAFISSFASKAVMYIFLLLALLFVNIGIALWLSKLMQHSFAGFFCMAGFYVLLTIIFWLGRKRFIKYPMQDAIIKKLMQ